MTRALMSILRRQPTRHTGDLSRSAPHSPTQGRTGCHALTGSQTERANLARRQEAQARAQLYPRHHALGVLPHTSTGDPA